MDIQRRGYSCFYCRQRFPLNANVSVFRCPACYTTNVCSSRPSLETSSNFGVSCLVEKFKNLLNHYQKISDSDIPKSLNCNPSPLIGKLPYSPARRSRKRALLVGITYNNTPYRLEGTVTDVKNMRELLIRMFCFQPDNILVLTEEETRAELIPTKKNIMAGLRWLVEDCQCGDSMVFYFSGHGSRRPDFNKDERDGFDEVICPLDDMEEGTISDNVINATIVWPLPKGVTLHAIVDACHSGTILDLVYVYDKEKRIWTDNSPPNMSRKHKNGGWAISIGACEDDQTAAATTAFSNKGKMNGALTCILIETVKRYPGATYAHLIDMIYETIDEYNRSGSLTTRIVRTMAKGNIIQKPLLSASEQFDVQNNHFLL